jgi:predicted acetyltransferase
MDLGHAGSGNGTGICEKILCHRENNHELITRLEDTPALKFFQKKDLSRMLHFSKIRRYELMALRHERS